MRLPAQQPPPGCTGNQIIHAQSAIYGTRDAGIYFYKHFCKKAAEIGFEELKLERAVWVLRHAGEVVAVICSHVDDVLCSFMLAGDGGRRAAEALAQLQQRLHMVAKESPFVYCGKRIVANARGVGVSQQECA